LLVKVAWPTQSTYSLLHFAKIPFPKANEMVVKTNEMVLDVGALWAQSIQSLFSFVH
jgi:hypothetical protein